MLPPRIGPPIRFGFVPSRFALVWRSVLKRALPRTFLMFIALWSAAACSQSEGEPCQVKSDCDDGLICCPALQTPRGTCITDSVCPAAEEPDVEDDDAGEEADASETTE